MTLKPIALYLFCPYCSAPNGYLYSDLVAKCVSCGKEKDVYDLFFDALSKNIESALWSCPLSMLSTFNIAEIFQGIIHQDNFTIKAFSETIFDLNKLGIPEKARILVLNFTPSMGEYFVMPAHIFGNSKTSIDEIPHKLPIYGAVLGLKDKKFKSGGYGKDASKVDSAEHHKASVFIRWCNINTDVLRDHMIFGAENYSKNDLPKMVYNIFSAFELKISNTLERFWTITKKLAPKEYESLFNRLSIYQKINDHIPLMCRELGIKIDKNKLALLNALREQRNSVVHYGALDTKKEHDKNKLYSISCWAILFLNQINERIDANK